MYRDVCRKTKKTRRAGVFWKLVVPHLALTAGIGTLPRGAGCRGFIGPFPPPLLIRYEIVGSYDPWVII